MRRSLFLAAALSVSLPNLSNANRAVTGLTLEDRIHAETAIARVLHRHQIGETRSFEQAYSDEALGSVVRTYLAQSAVLEKLWGLRVTEAMLRAEGERIARPAGGAAGGARQRSPINPRDAGAPGPRDPALLWEE